MPGETALILRFWGFARGYIREGKEVSAMAVKALNFKMEESDIREMKQVASVLI